jgi:uncharacterized repeat protein (TIGR01451 family)/LPXTG-motif cell wall-anchored protein
MGRRSRAVVTAGALALAGWLGSAGQVSAQAASADLALTQTGPSTAVTGQTVAYTITVVNNGPDEATSLALDEGPSAALDPVSLSGPAGWTCGSVSGLYGCTAPTLANGATAVFTFTATIKPGYEGTTATNAAAVFTFIDTSRADNIATVSTQIVAGTTTVAPTTVAPATTVAATPTTLVTAGPAGVTPTVTVPTAGGSPVTPVASTVAPAPPAAGGLPATGPENGIIAAVGAAFVVAGLGLLALRRRAPAA